MEVFFFGIIFVNCIIVFVVVDVGVLFFINIIVIVGNIVLGIFFY